MNGEKEKKALLRKEIKNLLNNCSVSLLKEKSKLIQLHLSSLPEYKNSSCVMFYVSMEKEVITHDIIKTALLRDKEVVVPLVLQSQNIMLPCKIEDFKDLKPGPFGILQPVKEKIQNIPLSSLDLIIVPGMAFDRKGNRLGRGKGFYDSFLKLIKPKIPKVALAFSSQIIEEVSVTENDISVDKIVTEDGIINCKL